jgi:hypothetical protein
LRKYRALAVSLKKTNTETNYMKPIESRLISTQTFFVLTTIVVSLTVLSVWLSGLEQHRTLFANSILTTTFLSVAFFLFLSIGLYNGVKLKDDIGKIVDNFQLKKMPDILDGASLTPSELPDLDFDDSIFGVILGIIVSVLLWILVSFFLVLLLWIFSNVLWVTILAFIAMLYWIFFRALRLVFKNSNKCKGKLITSFVYGLSYTILYNFWIYGIMLATYYLTR